MVQEKRDYNKKKKGTKLNPSYNYEQRVTESKETVIYKIMEILYWKMIQEYQY